MSNTTLVKDIATRNSLKKIEKSLSRIENIKQLSSDSSLKEIIDTINKITDSLKRR